MAGTDGQTTNSLIEQLAREPFRFDFFRAVRLLENQRRDLPRVGCSLSPADDPVRFGQNPSLAFAPSAIEAFQPAPPGAVPKLFVRFLGLLGPNGPMPLHLTEYVHERQLNFGDHTIAGFLNVFHHRLISLFYRAWAANQKVVDMDRPGDQRFATYIGSLLGIGMESLQSCDPVPDQAKLYFSGWLAAPTRCADGLEALLQEFFGIQTAVQPFAGRWINLPPDSVCQLGGPPESGSLGLTTILGSRFWECQLSFRLRLGPMKLADYERMLPHNEAFKRLQCWIANYCGEHFWWDAQLVLEAGEVPDTCLGRAGRLGWTTWIKTEPFARDAEDLILAPPAE
jgi:type VI secretion system protein ImpH